MDFNQTFIKVGRRDPESSYQKVRGENTYLLESCEGSMKKARYSFIGLNPLVKVSFSDKPIVEVFEGDFQRELLAESPFELMQKAIEGYQLKSPSLSRFCGGFVGYIGYEAIKEFVDIEKLSDTPLSEFILTKNNIIFDHLTNETYIVENHLCPASEIDVEESIRELEEIGTSIDEENEGANEPRYIDGYTSNFTQHEFEEAVRSCKNYIKEGDIFQTVLSQRLESSYGGDKFDVYKRLLKINPSPYMYYLDFGERVIVGASPETLARVEDGVVSTYPIAGTRRRGKTEQEDKFFERELLGDAKENAEHLMLVDLGRNDVGKIAEFGSVKVSKFREIERYSHVMHMSSEVTGTLRSGLTEFDALKSIFPAGTVSGAPKVRACEIIDELEPDARGIYAGCVGYFSFSRSLDTAICIRTIVFEGDTAKVQAGAGIVSDSEPTAEYKETLNKAKALMKALEEPE